MRRLRPDIELTHAILQQGHGTVDPRLWVGIDIAVFGVATSTSLRVAPPDAVPESYALRKPVSEAQCSSGTRIRFTRDGPNDSQVASNGCCSMPGSDQSHTPWVKMASSRAHSSAENSTP